MKLKLFVFILTVFSLSHLLAAEDDYNRAQCDKVIGVEKFIVAGSLDDKRPGGKTYNFNKIVGAIENELLGAQDPRPEHFECYTKLFYKAHADAEDYWVNRFLNSSCTNQNGDVPRVKPESCDAKTWHEYHRSMKLIERSVASVKRVTEECVEDARSGKKSCESMNALMGLKENLGAPIEENKMDKCCNTKEGPAFRILRSYYTYEFGSLNDADLQKECYKRTRPDKRSSSDKLAEGALNCLTGIGRGIFESILKLARTAKSLWEMGIASEILKILTTNPLTTLEKLVEFVKEVFKQSTAHFESFTECFSPVYKADHGCKVVSSMVLEFFTGKKAFEMVAAIAKSGAKMGTLAKQLIADSRQAKRMQSEMTNAANAGRGSGGGGGAGAAGVRPSLKVTTAMRNFSQRMGQRLKAMGDIRKNISRRVRQEGAGNPNSRAAASNRPQSPNGSATVAAETAPSPVPSSVPKPTSAATAAAPRPVATPTTAAPRIRGSGIATRSRPALAGYKRDLRAFDRSPKRNVRLKNPEKHIADRRKFERAKTKEEKLALMEQGAKRRHLQVTQLENTSGVQGISASSAAQMRSNIDKALNDWKRANGFSTGLSGGMTTVSTSAVRAADGSTASSVRPSPSAVADSGTSSAPSAGGSTAKTAPGNNSVTGTSPMTVEIPPLSSIDLGRIASTPVTSAALQTSVNNTLSFIQRASGAVGTNGTQSTVRNSIYGRLAERGIKRESLARHRDIEKMFQNGLINETEALAFHRMVVTAEMESVGKATRFSTSYVVAPNANPATFSSIPKPKKPTLTGSIAKGITIDMASNAMENKALEQFSDKNNNERYTESTIKESQKIYEKLSASPVAITKEFDTLKTEEAIYDKADELRAKVKTFEATAGATSDEAQKAEITKILDLINSERDRAIDRVTGNTASSPKSTPRILYEDELTPSSATTSRQPAQKRTAPVRGSRPPSKGANTDAGEESAPLIEWETDEGGE
ncbi:MAG: hypothetical protein JNL11_12805 [Bdellovibrionaceae bacterium]|nr:hypothetical protein [Pseudobdellovibrionaceae bacterium]